MEQLYAEYNKIWGCDPDCYEELEYGEKCIQRVYERHQKSFENACKTDWYLSACWRWMLIYTNAKKQIAFSKKADKSYKILMFSEK